MSNPAGTLRTTGIQTGVSGAEIAALAIANEGIAWTDDGCAAFVWGITNLAGLPFFDTHTGDPSQNSGNAYLAGGAQGNPTQPLDVGYIVPHLDPHSGSGTPDISGDGWSAVWTGSSMATLKSQLQVGDVVRLYKSGNTTESDGTQTSPEAHSFIVVSVSGSDVEVVDNWNWIRNGGTISEHSFDDFSSWTDTDTATGNFQSAIVSRINSAYVNENVPPDLQGWGVGNWSGISSSASPAAPNMLDSLSAEQLAGQASSIPQQYQTIAFYLDRPAGPFNVTDANEISQSGRSLVSIYEKNQGANQPSYFTTAQADADAATAITAALALGQPLGSTIYFGVEDSDGILSASNLSAIDAYFAEISADFASLGWLITNVGPIASVNPYQIGIYGGGSVLSSVQSSVANINYYWFDSHFGGSFSAAQITRNANDTRVAGVDVDTDTVTATNFGQWSTNNGPILPDLVVDSLVVSPSTTLGGGVEISTTIGNNSTAGTGAFEFQIYFSTSPTLDSHAAYIQFTAPSLPGNGTFSWGESVLLPSWITTAGQYYVIVDVNQNESVTESSYNNDSYHAAFAVEGSTNNVASGTTVTVSAGQTSNGMDVEVGGHLVVAGGGTVVNTLDDGVETVSAGGTDSAASLSSGRQDLFGYAQAGFAYADGLQQVFAGGVASGLTTSSGAGQQIQSGGTAVGTVATSGSYQLVNPQGVAIDATIESAALQYVSDGTAIGTELAGNQYVSSGGFASATTVSSGGYEQVDSAGSTSATTVLGGGEQDILLGSAIATTLAGGAEFVFSGGVADGTIVGSGGLESVGSGGHTSGAVIAGGTLALQSGAIAGGPIIFAGGISGGTLNIAGSSMPANTISGFAPGDAIYLFSIRGGNAGTANLLANNVLEVIESNQSYTLQLDPSQDFSDDQFQLSSSGGGTIITESSGPIGNGATLNIEPGETRNGLTVVANGTLNVLSGGTANDTLNDGGFEDVFSGGVENGATVAGQGTLSIAGTGIGATVSSGSFGNVASGGTSIATTLLSHSFSEILSGGTTIGTQDDGGGLSVFSGGTDIGGITNTGGYDIINFGATASAASINGGTLEVHGTIAGGVGFEGAGGTLKLVMLTMPTATISGFAPGDVIDLTEVFYGSGGGVQLLSGNTAQFVANGSSYSLNFDPSQSFAGERFYLATDGFGTEVLLSSGGFSIAAGQTSSGASITSNEVLNVNSGGTAIATVIFAGGTAAVYGTADDTQVESGGLVAVLSGGVADPTTIFVGGNEVVSAGGTDLGALVSGGVQDVFGLASGAIIFSGGQQVVFGAASATTLSGGLEFVEIGGLASGTIASSGGAVFDYGGARGTQADGGGYDIVQSGGTDLGATISAGGQQAVYGIASGTVVLAGGFAFVQIGGLASGTIVSSGGAVFDSATASATQVNSGGYDIVQSGGTDIGAAVSGGGQQFVFGTARATGLGVAGFEWVESGGVASGTVVSSGAAVFDYGVASGTQVKSGGYDVDEGGGTDIGAAVSSGGLQFVFGVASATALGSTGFEYVESGGLASGTVVSSGGAAFDYGVASGAQVKSGAYDIVESGGTDVGATLSAGGLEVVYSGALATGAVASGTGAELLVLSGGTLSGATLSAGGFDVVSGIAVSTTINSGGIEGDNGVVHGAQVHSVGLEIVEVGALASGVVVSGTAAQLLVLSGGTVSGATLSGGGSDDVRGTAVSTTINNAGIEDDQNVTSATIINAGGIQVVDVGGTASGAVAMNGGTEVVISGGTAIGTTISSGGFMEVRSGGSVSSSTVTFAGGGTLQLDDSVHFGGLVAGFGLPGQLDLRDISFISGTTSGAWAQSGTSGTLTVTDGTHTAHLTLLGQYVAGQFHVGSDGHGGTVVTDPPVGDTSLVQPAGSLLGVTSGAVA